jgi:4Fe-4S ferredoxin
MPIKEDVPDDTCWNPSFDALRAKRTANVRGGGSGERCLAPAGQYQPVVNRSRCEGKADCVAVCPFNVFEVRAIDEGEYRKLSMFTRLKLWTHGKQTAYTPRSDACQACSLCVVACPERAISLIHLGVRT